MLIAFRAITSFDKVVNNQPAKLNTTVAFRKTLDLLFVTALR